MSEHTLDDWPICSVGNAVITPDWSCQVAGYQNNSEKTDGVNLELEVNHLATSINGKPFVLVSIDVLFSSELLKILIYRKLRSEIKNLALENIVLQASHTHSAPSVDRHKPILGEIDKQFVRLIAETLCASIKSNLEKPRVNIASAQHGRGICDQNIYRRKLSWSRVPKRFIYRYETVAAPNDKWQVDHHIRISLLSNIEGKAVAAFWSYPCHAVSNFPATKISSDFPGYVRTVIREHLMVEDLTVVFFPGFCGDIRPNNLEKSIRINLQEQLSTPFIRKFSKPSAMGYEQFKNKLKSGVGDALDQALSAEPNQTSPSSAQQYSELSLSMLIDGFNGGADPYLRNWQIDLPPMKLNLFNAEISSAYSEESLDDGYFPSGCTNSVFGYLPTDQQIARGGYEVVEFFQMFGITGAYKSKINEVLGDRFGLITWGQDRE